MATNRPDAAPIFTREDGVRAVQMMFLADIDKALMLAEAYELADDPWISRLYECRDVVARALDPPGRRASRPRDGAPPALRLVK